MQWSAYWTVWMAATMVAGAAAMAWAPPSSHLAEALHAAMFYALMRSIGPNPERAAVAVAVVFGSIELLQATGIPARHAASYDWILRSMWSQWGTEFRWLDLVAYAVGIAAMYTVDRLRR